MIYITIGLDARNIYNLKIFGYFTKILTDQNFFWSFLFKILKNKKLSEKLK